tara:strand:+ start:713 stop:961 length:249 start_codon:yes stop_codon:yes gene_type:complete
MNKYPEIPDDARLTDMLLLAKVMSKSMSKELQHYSKHIENIEFLNGTKDFFSSMLSMFTEMSEMNAELLQKCLDKAKGRDNE